MIGQAGSAEALAYTALVTETAAAFRAVNPGTQVCLPTAASRSCIAAMCAPAVCAVLLAYSFHLDLSCDLAHD